VFELRVARAEDDELGERIVALVERLGAGRYAVFFGAYKDSLGAAPVPEYTADEMTGADAPAPYRAFGAGGCSDSSPTEEYRAAPEVASAEGILLSDQVVDLVEPDV